MRSGDVGSFARGALVVVGGLLAVVRPAAAQDPPSPGSPISLIAPMVQTAPAASGVAGLEDLPARRSALAGLRLDLVDRRAGDRAAAALRDGGPRPAFRLDLFPDVSLVARIDAVEPASDGRGTVWIGRIDGRVESSITLVASDGVVAANVRTGDGSYYQIRYVSPGIFAIHEIDESRMPEELEPLVPAPSVPSPAEGRAGEPNAPAEFAADDGSTIDVMVVVTPAVVSAAGGLDATNNLIALAIAETNQGYANSGVIQRVRLVRTETVSYTEDPSGSGAFYNALTALTSKTDGRMDNVHAIRDTHGADMVSLWIERNDSCGIAWVMTSESNAFHSSAFSVAARNCATGYFTFAHEMGHNQGSLHDRAVSSGPGVRPFSFGFVQNASNPRYRTIMAYSNACGSCMRVNHWSSPLVTYLGLPTGIAHPAPDSADNARSLNETRVTAANWRPSSETPPTITPSGGWVLEGNAGTTMMDFLVTLSAPKPFSISLQYATVNGTATGGTAPAPGIDFVHTAGTLTFAPGEKTRLISVPIVGDIEGELGEDLFLDLWSPTFGAISNGHWRGYIAADDPVSVVRIDDVSLDEGNSGATNAIFTVRLSETRSEVVTVSALARGLTATAGVDFTPTATTLTFPPGQTAQTLAVPILGDTDVEYPETFEVVLSNSVNAVIVDAVGIGTIRNDDLAARTFASPTGKDQNFCADQVTPCRNIAGALLQTAMDGEIIILSPGEYEVSTLSITKGIKITSPSGTVALIRQPITINAPDGNVILRGLTLKGAGAGNGITLTAADSVSIEDSTIDRWATGLWLNNAAASRVSMLNTIVRNNTAGILDTGASTSNRVAINESRFERNAKGLEILTGTFQVKDSTFSGNTTSGIVVGPGVVDIQRSEFSLNAVGLSTLSGGTARIGRSHVFGNTIGLSAAAGSTLSSFGTNVIRGNGTDTSGTITAVVEQ